LRTKATREARFAGVIVHLASVRKEMRSAALMGSKAGKRTSASRITATKSVSAARGRSKAGVAVTEL